MLVDSTVEASQEALDYVKNHLNAGGTVYLPGGPSALETTVVYGFIIRLHQSWKSITNKPSALIQVGCRTEGGTKFLDRHGFGN